LASSITKQRAERIARGHACVKCQEYSYKKLTVKPASAEHRAELGVVWQVVAVCGICGTHQELGIDGEGDVVYAG
jgi:transcription elongation factor Elf1